MLRGRWSAITAACAIGVVAAVTAGCGGGGTGRALSLDPVAAAATKTRQAGAARIRFAVALSGPESQGRTLRLHGIGAVDGTSSETTFRVGPMLGRLGLPAATRAQLLHGSMKEIALEQGGDYVVYVRLGVLASQLPGGKEWIKLDLSKLGKSAGVDLGKLLSGSQLQPGDVLSTLETEGASIHKLGSTTIDGAETTHYRVTVDVGKALQSKGLTSPLLGGFAAQMPKLPEDVWIGKNGLVRRIRIAYGLSQAGKHVRMAMTMDLFDYGAQVSISAPPSSDVFDVTQFVQQGLGSALLH